uniref:Uncharacterized protein n=1 Tax=Lactuca sativa TaxID=4236 RepID=A0A9R1W0G5_LACSA|nr:hypothetical protein LSAT_V11C300106220 [Lactuca sativa]
MNERRGKKRKQPPLFSTTVPVEEAPPKHPLTVAKNPNPIFFIGSPEKRSRTRRMINRGSRSNSSGSQNPNRIRRYSRSKRSFNSDLDTSLKNDDGDDDKTENDEALHNHHHWHREKSIRWSTVGRYRVDVASFESLALPELQFKEDTDLFVIDEVGKMELFSSLFFPAVLCVLESKKINLRWLFLPTDVIL